MKLEWLKKCEYFATPYVSTRYDQGFYRIDVPFEDELSKSKLSPLRDSYSNGYLGLERHMTETRNLVFEN